MKTEATKTITLTFTGTITVAHNELEPLFRAMQVQAILPAPRQEEPAPRKVEPAGATARLAFSLKEAADALGVSTVTIYRLIQRGLLRSSGALRCKLIPKAEIERFLKETTKAIY